MVIKRRLIFGIFFVLTASFGGGLGTSVFYEAHYNPTPVVLGDDFEQVINRYEAELAPKEGTAKAFVWRFPDHRATPLALVQLHGFSASRREIAPVGEDLAANMGWNLFMTRLTGHGLGAAGMGTLTAEALLQDAEEAFAVGRRMGGKVVLLGTSTGAVLALYLATRYPDQVAALVLVSPNFRPKDPKSLLLKGPLGGWLAEHVITENRWKAESPQEEYFWTTAYPMSAAHEMMNMLSWIEGLPIKDLKIPLLMFYSDQDRVVAVDRMKEFFESYRGSKKLVEVSGADHVLAGTIKSPQNTEKVEKTAEEFLKGL